jgi:NADH:ubiquinone oxidoreductase subunit 6 (subunit J)
MRLGASLFLIAVGAILAFAVNVDNTNGFNINTAGVILMIVGAVGLLFTAIWMSTRQRTDIVERGTMGTRGTTVLSPNDPLEGPY